MNAEHIWTILLLAEIFGAKDVFKEGLRQLERCLKVDEQSLSVKNRFLSKCFPSESETLLQRLLQDLTRYLVKFSDAYPKPDSRVYETPPRPNNESPSSSAFSGIPEQLPPADDRRSKSPLAVSWEQIQLQYLRSKGVSEKSTSRILQGPYISERERTPSSSSKRSTWTQTPPSPSPYRYSAVDEDEASDDGFVRSYDLSISRDSDRAYPPFDEQRHRYRLSRDRYAYKDDIFDDELPIKQSDDFEYSIRQQENSDRVYGRRSLPNRNSIQSASQKYSNSADKASLRSSRESIDSNQSYSQHLSNEAANQIVQAA